MLNARRRELVSAKCHDRRMNQPGHSRLTLEQLEPRTVLSGGPFFMGIGDLPGGDVFSDAVAISNDGSTVVGRSKNAAGDHAVRWTVSEGNLQPLGLLDGASSSWANGANYDGSVIVGWSPNGNSEAFRWTASTGMVELPLPPNSTDLDKNDIGSAFGVSDNGRVVAGYHNGPGPVVWKDGIVAELPSAPGTWGSGRALAVSGSGSFIVGHTHKEGVVSEAFLWNEQSNTTLGLGSLGDATGVDTTHSLAYDVSADGSVVVGRSERPLNKKGNKTTTEAFRWTADDGMVSLGTLGVDSSAAYAVSGDGSIIGGSGDGAFIWDAVNGTRDLQQLLVDEYGLGSDLAGWELGRVTDISADGRTAVGSGTNPGGFREGWIAHLAPPPGISVTPTSGLETSEDGTTAYFDVVLDTDPTAPVAIDVSPSDETEGTIVGAMAGVLTLVFDATNWDVPQTVTLQGVDDADQDGNQAYMIQLAPAVSTDPAYSGLDAADVMVTNLDNEAPPPATDTVYAWEITHDIRNRGKHTDVSFTINVNQDSNFDGMANSSDAAAAGALVTIELFSSGGVSVGTYTGATDWQGILQTDWIRGLDKDVYTAEVIDVALAGFDWTQLPGLNGIFNDDADGDGLPDELFTIE